MFRMESSKPARRVRRRFTDEFKAGAVRLVVDEGQTIGAVARDLDLTASSLAEWVKRAQADRTKGRTGLTTVARDIRKTPAGSMRGRRRPSRRTRSATAIGASWSARRSTRAASAWRA